MNTTQLQLKNWKNIPFIKQLIKEFPKAEIFLVGGIVRDSLLGRSIKDADLVVRNVPKPKLEKFLARAGKVSLVGKKFGVFKFAPKNWDKSWGQIDIALPRTEHSLNWSGAYRDFKIQSHAGLPIEDDLSRRDFTINAMAWDIVTNKLVDPFGGQADLRKKTIRAVGKAEARLAEDYSRMLRAIRFACQLGFTIEPKTWRAIVANMKKINKVIDGQRVVPYEVVAKELIKALVADPIAALKLLDNSGGIKLLLPELLKMKNCPQPTNWHSEGDVWVHTLLALKNLRDKKFKSEFKNYSITPELIIGLIFHDLGKPYTITKTDRIRFHGHDQVSAEKFREIASRLKLASTGLNLEVVEKIVAKHMILANPALKEMKDITVEKYFFNQNFPGQELLMLIFCDVSATLPQSGQANFTNYKILKSRINQLKRQGKNQKALPAPLINGRDIMKVFKLKAGPKIGELLALAREAQLNGRLKTKPQGLKWLKKYL